MNICGRNEKIKKKKKKFRPGCMEEPPKKLLKRETHPHTPTSRPELESEFLSVGPKNLHFYKLLLRGGRCSQAPAQHWETIALTAATAFSLRNISIMPGLLPVLSFSPETRARLERRRHSCLGKARPPKAPTRKTQAQGMGSCTTSCHPGFRSWAWRGQWIGS